MLNYKKRPLQDLKIGQAMKKSLKEFANQTLVHCYHYVVEPNRHFVEILMWWTLHIIITIAAIYIMMYAWSSFTDNPTITTLESQHYPIYNLNFPAVGICSNNKISRREAENYADFLMKSERIKKSYETKEKVMEMIRYFGRIYDPEERGKNEFVRFQDILDDVDVNQTTGSFELKQTLYRLAPKCEDLLVRCKWADYDVNCFQLFETRRSSEGFCCMFNYAKRTDKHTQSKKAYKPLGIGRTMGITVLLNLSTSDYFYQSKSFNGATVLIFNPQEFADITSGGVGIIPVQAYHESNIAVQITTKVAEREVQSYSIEKRECMFPSDNADEYNGDYIYSDCLVKCKLKSVLALCNCVPFNSPTNFHDVPTAHLPFCNLDHVGCLSKYRVKWLTYRPRESIPGLELEMEDGLSCPSCYPLCSSSTYNVDSTSAHLNFFYEYASSIISGFNDSEDLTVFSMPGMTFLVILAEFCLYVLASQSLAS
ncbi:CLUMA_CG002364, isoform A [Clunio marinus]|uniref:CLUMA_CG002364, isoform A n=1 Tax=Clunio marinus TaxID=568069 RepID=A0A1J1HMT7_9DIPT|nr:CLUMA_CG002364, isoform A [Clunio marinus]